MIHPMPPAILVVGQQQADRLNIARILQEAGFIAIDCPPSREEIEAANGREEIQLIVSVDLPRSQERSLFHYAGGDPARRPLVYYIKGGPGVVPHFEADAAELTANIRTLLRVREAAAQGRARLDEEAHNRNEFLAMLAHELRNPLAPITNAAHVLRMHAPANDTLLWAIGMVERQTRHLTRIVDDLLDVSRITRGKVELHRELVTLRTVLQNAAEAARPFMADRGHDFQVEVPEENLWLDVDPTRLEQVLNNLLHNAAKYTPRGGRIMLRAGREDPGDRFPTGAVAINVGDTGIGIAPEMLGRVFDVFSQAERTLDRAEGGLGLGLTLVRRLTEMHQGMVEAHSDGLGRGSVFVLRLPLVPLAPETFEVSPRHPEQEAGSEQGAPGQGRRVLVIDDQVDTAQSLAELLEIWGHEVRVGYDGPAAVDLAAKFGPEVVLLDIGLPLMNGYEVAQHLRQDHGHDMLIVALTGYGQDEDRRRALEAGFDQHLTKPVDLGVLRELISSGSPI